MNPTTSPSSNPTTMLNTKLGLRERIKTAQSINELEELFTLTSTYKSASSQTIRRWNKAYSERKSQLLSL